MLGKKKTRILVLGLVLGLFLLVLGPKEKFLAQGETSWGREALPLEVMEEEVEDFLDRYWFKAGRINFEDLKREYLLEENTLFNREMEIRTEFSNGKQRLREESQDLVVDDWVEYARDLEIIQQEDGFLALARAERIYRYQNEDGTTSDISSDLTDVVLDFKVRDGQAYLVDLVDRTSCYFDRDTGINGLAEPLDLQALRSRQEQVQAQKSPQEQAAALEAGRAKMLAWLRANQ